MADYERSREIAATADTVFDYLCDIRNLPKYFERMTSAKPGDGETIWTTARIDTGDGVRDVEGEAWFRVNREAHSIAWGSEGPNDYHGELSVSPKDAGSTVTVSIHTTRTGDDAKQQIDAGLDQTLANIATIFDDS
jgi:carbon monoxide dehydrogenase subunit G